MAVKNKKAKVLELDNLLSVPTFNRKINFGKNSAAIQFTNSTSPLIISGSNNGLNISGSSISDDTTTIAAGTAANASSFIALDSNNKLIKTDKYFEVGMRVVKEGKLTENKVYSKKDGLKIVKKLQAKDKKI